MACKVDCLHKTFFSWLVGLTAPVWGCFRGVVVTCAAGGRTLQAEAVIANCIACQPIWEPVNVAMLLVKATKAQGHPTCCRDRQHLFLKSRDNCPRGRGFAFACRLLGRKS